MIMFHQHAVKRLYSPVAFIAQHSIPTTSPVLSVEDSLRTVLHLDCRQLIKSCSPGPEDRDLGHATRVSCFALLWHDCCCVNALLIFHSRCKHRMTVFNVEDQRYHAHQFPWSNRSTALHKGKLHCMYTWTTRCVLKVISIFDTRSMELTSSRCG